MGEGTKGWSGARCVSRLHRSTSFVERMSQGFDRGRAGTSPYRQDLALAVGYVVIMRFERGFPVS